MKRREFYRDGVRQIDSSDFSVAFNLGYCTSALVLLTIPMFCLWMMLWSVRTDVEQFFALPQQSYKAILVYGFFLCLPLLFSGMCFWRYWQCRNQEYFLADFPGSPRWVLPLVSFVGLPFYVGSYLRMRHWEKETNYQPRDVNDEECDDGTTVQEDITTSMPPVDLSPVFDDFAKYYRMTEATREALERQDLSRQTEFIRRRTNQYGELVTNMQKNLAQAEQAEKDYQPTPPLDDVKLREELQQISKMFGVRAVRVITQPDQPELHIEVRIYTISRDGTYYLGDYRIEIDQFCNASCICIKSGVRADYQEVNPGYYCQNSSVELSDLMHQVIKGTIISGNIAQAVHTLLISLQGTIVEGDWKNLGERFKRVVPPEPTTESVTEDQPTEKEGGEK